MARQPSTEDAYDDELDSEDELAEADDADADAEGEDDDESDGGERSAGTDEFWAEVRVAPVEIALPKGVGFTLRAYRPSTEVAEPEIDEDEDDDEFAALRHDEEVDEEALPEFDEDELTRLALAAGDRPEEAEDDEADGDTEPADADADAEAADAEAADAEADETDDETDSDAAAADEEDDDDDDDEDEDVPVFLAQHGRLLLFGTAEGLVEYVRTADDHDLVQLDTWPAVRARIREEDVVPLDEDRYELDLVVENLRGGHDAWNPMLIIQAGEIARDLGHALRIQPVVTALAPGSPLDDLDEGLRGVEAGGVGGFFARRRVRKIDAQTTAALGWRTIIGKISALVDWRN